MEQESIKIQEHPLLFKDYIQHNQDAVSFYRWYYKDDWMQCVHARLKNYRMRKRLYPILKEQNTGWNAPEPVLNNIEIFTQSNTLTVVTGQQAGLYGGPFYTVYKAITVIKLAEELRKQFPDMNFVPCFWMEVGDNDYEEINHFHLLNSANELIRLELPKLPDDFRPVYRRTVPPEIEKIHKQIGEACLSSEFRESVLDELANIYSVKNNFADAFAQLLLNWFGSEGLVVMNPADPRIRELTAFSSREALEKRQLVQEAIQSVTAKLEQKGYHGQIQFNTHQTLLFLETEDGARARIDSREGKFWVGHPANPFRMEKEELMELLERHPEKFSPNVALRPIHQDILLPTVAYVAGPAEISYAAQIMPLYRLFGVEPPVFYPRLRLTLIERKIRKLIRKFDLKYDDLFENRDGIVDRIIRQRSGEQLQEEFKSADRQIRQLTAQLHEALMEVDPTLEPALEKTQNHFDNALKKLHKKADQAVKRKMDTEVRQLNKISIHLFPGNEFQERVLNIVHHLVKYGPDFIHKLYRTVLLNPDEHHLVYLQ